MADKKKHSEQKDVHTKSDEAKETSKKQVKSDKSSDKALKQEIADLKAKLDKMEDSYLRAEAEVKNVQRHAQQDQANLLKYDGQKLATSIIPVVDNLKRALAVEVNDEAGKKLKSGVEMVTKHLDKALVENKVEEMKPKGQKFDPTLYQAVQTVPSDDEHPADTVVEVLQNGYTLSGRVLRPAMVIVAQ